MRIAIAFTLALSLLGCGGKSAPASKDAMATDTTRKLGTSGYPGLDWGASADDVKAKFPRAAAGGETLSVSGNHGGKPGVTTFELKDGKLQRITISFEDEYPSMDDCQTVWTELRAAFDAELGESKADNLAAYWDSTTYNIILSCDPGEDEAGVLSMSYGPPQD